MSDGPSQNELLRVAVAVAEAVEQCGLRYSIGGSLASAVNGEPRSTLDVDILVDLPPTSVDAFVRALGTDFYLDPDAVARAVRDHSSANVFHHHTSIKVDVFVAGDSVLERSQLDRRCRVHVTAGDLYVHSPEDLVLQKLHWYRLGGEVSDRQWRDTLGILSVQHGRLDLAFMTRTAATIGLDALLKRALAESDEPGPQD